jgi:hypothetical protein
MNESFRGTGDRKPKGTSQFRLQLNVGALGGFSFSQAYGGGVDLRVSARLTRRIHPLLSNDPLLQSAHFGMRAARADYLMRFCRTLSR